MPRYPNRNRNSTKPKVELNEDEQNPILKSFQDYSRELDSKHDRHERIVKLSRDITIESKRIIFLLHTIDGRKNNKEKILEEAQQRLEKVIEVNFRAVAKELLNQDVYQFRSAYSPGLQEFIEAYTFMEYFRSCSENAKGLSDWKALQSKMHYKEHVVKKETEGTAADDVQETKEIINDSHAEKPIEFNFHIEPTEYILGLSDLTGELMRRCINSLGSGETETCVDTCKALQDFYTGYTSLNVQRCRELSRKIYTMRQSVLKAENVCYNVKVRGGESAKWGSAFDSGKPGDDIDEGFY